MPFNQTPYSVISKTGNSVIVEAPGETQYSKNPHVKRFMGDDHVLSPGTATSSRGGIVIPTAVPSQVLSELTSAATPTPQSDPQIGSTLSAQRSAEDGNEAVAPVGTLQLIKQQSLARQQQQGCLRDP